MKSVILSSIAVVLFSGMSYSQYSKEPDIALAPSASLRSLPVVQQQTFFKTTQPGQQKLFQDEATYRRKRNLGVGLIIGGSALMVTGGFLLENALTDSRDFENGVEKTIISALVAASGAAGLGVGIPMVIKNNRRLNDLQKEKASLSFHYTGTGGKIVYRF
ncbi:MAG: hypothetical protein QM594_20225 [Niabella sp.]